MTVKMISDPVDGRTVILPAAHPERGWALDGFCDVDLGQLDLLQRLLLTTDGTVTQFLATSMEEQIEAVCLSQHVRGAGEERRMLALRPGQRVIDRRALLRGTVTGRNYLYGQSAIALGRVPRAVRHGLLHGDSPIGLLLRQHRTETFREILWRGTLPACEAARHFLLADGSPLLARRYRVWIDHRPAMLITELFPHAYPPAPSPPGSVQTPGRG
jgi:chorismate-pyruvate lyase